MSEFTLATIVEGDGEVAALPVLLRRLRPQWRFPKPIRVQRTKLIDGRACTPRDDILSKFLKLAHIEIVRCGGHGAVLVVIDADDNCPATLGRQIRQNAQALCPTWRCEAVLANREFEAWLLAGKCVNWPGDPESIRDAKQPLKDALGRYSPTADQARLAAKMDLAAAEQSRSFRHLLTVLTRFDNHLTAVTPH